MLFQTINWLSVLNIGVWVPVRPNWIAPKLYEKDAGLVSLTKSQNPNALSTAKYDWPDSLTNSAPLNTLFK